MRTIERVYKRASRSEHRATLDRELMPILALLVAGQSLQPRHRDHDLSGNWAGYRECHIRPDLLLIYRIVESNTLRLARLGSHSELFG